MSVTAIKTLLQYLHTPAARSAEEFGDAIQQEIAFHIAERAQSYQAEGMSAEAATRAAHQKFGDASRVAAECHRAAVGGVALWHRMHLALTAMLAVAVGALWFTLLSHREVPLASKLPPGIATMLNHDWTGDIAGQILNDRTQPIADADVLVVVKTWPDESYFQRAYAAVSDADGRFLISDVHPVNERYEVQIAVVADNQVLKSSYHSRSSGTLEPIKFELAPSSGFALQVETEDGSALARVEVLPRGRIETSGTEHLVYFDSAQLLMRRTDRNGRVELPYYRPGDTANVLLRTPQGSWVSRDVIVPPAGQVATLRTSLSNQENPEES